MGLKKPDLFLVGIITALLVGLLWPASSAIRHGLGIAGDIAVGLLFFLYGMRLKTREIIRGLTNVRVQGLIVAFTYILFPLLGLITHPLLVPLIGEGFARGFFYLTLLPSTIQSSVAFTGIARGDTAAAVCAATLSNISGMFITPALVLVFLHVDGSTGGSLLTVLTQLLLPFIVGQLMSPFFGEKLRAHPRILKVYDQSTIVLIVLSATLDSTASGVWSGVTVVQILSLILVSSVLLTVVLVSSWWLAGKVGCDRPGRIAVMMCGSKKSLSTGLPMAQALFPSSMIGPIAVPVIAFHQIQLMVCATLAARLGRSASSTDR